jgi:hypothetical protein
MPRTSCFFVAPLFFLALSACSDGEGGEDRCQPDDADGIIGGDVTFEVTVDDDSFEPRVLTAQNQANIELNLTNAGSRPLGFYVECLPTPNDDGCPSESCFPDAAQIEPIDPGDSASTTFQLPYVEGVYTIVSEPGEDEPSAQFVVR